MSTGGAASAGAAAAASTDDSIEEGGRRADGTFTKGSEAAKEAGHKGGLANANA